MQIGACSGTAERIVFPLGIVTGAAHTQFLANRYKDAALRTATIALAFSSLRDFLPLMPTGDLALLVAFLTQVIVRAEGRL